MMGASEAPPPAGVMEVNSSETHISHFSESLSEFGELMGVSAAHHPVVYAGSEPLATSAGDVVALADVTQAV